VKLQDLTVNEGCTDATEPGGAKNNERQDNIKCLPHKCIALDVSFLMLRRPDTENYSSVVPPEMFMLVLV